MDKTVEEYIKKQKEPQREICLKLRKLILKTLPGIQEEMKWGVPVYGGERYYIGAVKLGVNLGFSMKGLTEKEMDHFSGNGKMMRHIKIMSPDEIDEKNIVRLLKLVEKKQQ